MSSAKSVTDDSLLYSDDILTVTDYPKPQGKVSKLRRIFNFMKPTKAGKKSLKISIPSSEIIDSVKTEEIKGHDDVPIGRAKFLSYEKSLNFCEGIYSNTDVDQIYEPEIYEPEIYDLAVYELIESRQKMKDNMTKPSASDSKLKTCHLHDVKTALHVGGIVMPTTIKIKKINKKIYKYKSGTQVYINSGSVIKNMKAHSKESLTDQDDGDEEDANTSDEDIVANGEDNIVLHELRSITQQIEKHWSAFSLNDSLDESDEVKTSYSHDVKAAIHGGRIVIPTNIRIIKRKKKIYDCGPGTNMNIGNTLVPVSSRVVINQRRVVQDDDEDESNDEDSDRSSEEAAEEDPQVLL